MKQVHMSQESTAVVDVRLLATHFFSKAALLSSQHFRSVFKQLRDSYPTDMARLCVLHIAENGLDQLGRKVLGWLCHENLYLGPLLDPEFLSLALAHRAFEVFRLSDSQFSLRFSDVLTPDDPNFDRALLPRALDLLLGLENYRAFLGHIKVLTRDTNPHIRSKAVKAICQIRPNRFVVDNQVQAKDARVRANAIEALWHIATDEAAEVFRLAVADSNHRVVFNALVGLYFLCDPTALPRMLELAESNSVEFRRAAAWALGFIGEPKARSVLEKLQSDQSTEVRANAMQALARLRPEPEGTAERSEPLHELTAPELSIA
jgi:HEAT repeat protein